MSTTVQLELSIEDMERYTGVSGLKEAEIYRTVFNILNGLRVGASMLGAGAASYTVGVVLGAAAVIAPVFAAIAVFVSLGLPVAQAKQIVREQAVKGWFRYWLCNRILRLR